MQGAEQKPGATKIYGTTTKQAPVKQQQVFVEPDSPNTVVLVDAHAPSRRYDADDLPVLAELAEAAEDEMRDKEAGTESTVCFQASL